MVIPTTAIYTVYGASNPTAHSTTLKNGGSGLGARGGRTLDSREHSSFGPALYVYQYAWVQRVRQPGRLCLKPYGQV